LRETRRLIAQRGRREFGLADNRRVSQRGFPDLRDGEIHLVDAARLLARRGADLAHRRHDAVKRTATFERRIGSARDK
jgi:hypothetical protein